MNATPMLPGTAQSEQAPRYKPSSKVPSYRLRGPQLLGARDAFAILQDIAYVEQEHAIVLLLDVRHRLMSKVLVGKGSLTGVEVHPREVFRPAIAHGAADIIFAHNHPSGDPSPSKADILLTDRLRQTGDVVGIQLLDHIVVAGDGYVSFAERDWK